MRYAFDTNDVEFVGTGTRPVFRSISERSDRAAIATAQRLLDDDAVTGQVGIYRDSIHGAFIGYAIKYPNSTAFFEAAVDE